MRFGGRRISSNVGSQGSGGGFGFPMGGGGGMNFGGGGLGCGGIVIVIIIALVFGVNPMTLMEGGQVVAPHQQGAQNAGGTPEEVCSADEVTRFSCQVLASTEDRWGELFQAAGGRYQPPKLWFYQGGGRSACGAAQSAMGPFYCPGDRSIYIDTTFFEELARNYGAPGDFAQAYVIAHEVGHHIQTLDGTSQQVRAQQARASRTEGNRLSVAIELQADCYAGVWAARERQTWEEGDIEEGLRAAAAIGDDRLQKQAQGYAVPESFTHGTSAQRQQALQRGLESGDPAVCALT